MQLAEQPWGSGDVWVAPMESFPEDPTYPLLFFQEPGLRSVCGSCVFGTTARTLRSGCPNILGSLEASRVSRGVRIPPGLEGPGGDLALELGISEVVHQVLQSSNWANPLGFPSLMVPAMNSDLIRSPGLKKTSEANIHQFATTDSPFKSTPNPLKHWRV